jgi:hypothetical protein
MERLDEMKRLRGLVATGEITKREYQEKLKAMTADSTKPKVPLDSTVDKLEHMLDSGRIDEETFAKKMDHMDSDGSDDAEGYALKLEHMLEQGKISYEDYTLKLEVSIGKRKDEGGDEREPRMCCMAMTASCIACSNGLSIDELCESRPLTPGCKKEGAEEAVPERDVPRACCRAMTASCRACSSGLSMADFCESRPRTPGCKAEEDTPRPEPRPEHEGDEEEEDEPRPERDDDEVGPLDDPWSFHSQICEIQRRRLEMRRLGETDREAYAGLDARQDHVLRNLEESAERAELQMDRDREKMMAKHPESADAIERRIEGAYEEREKAYAMARAVECDEVDRDDVPREGTVRSKEMTDMAHALQKLARDVGEKALEMSQMLDRKDAEIAVMRRQMDGMRMRLEARQREEMENARAEKISANKETEDAAEESEPEVEDKKKSRPEKKKESGCVDDADFYYEKKSRTCDWVAKKPNRTKKHCKVDIVASACKQTCEKC